MTHPSVNCQAIQPNVSRENNNNKKTNVVTGVHRRKDLDRNCPDLLVLFSLVHYRLWEGLAVCSCIKRPHRPHAQIVYYITVGFPPLTKHSPHDLSAPLTPNSSVHLWQGAVNEWWIASEQSAVVQHNQTVKVLSVDMFTLQSRTLPLPDPNLQINELAWHWDAQALCAGLWDWRAAGGWVTEEQKTGRWWSVGTWLGGFTANCLQAGEFNPRWEGSVSLGCYN